ncbi:hypothetical protein Tco_0875465 [Tanacetum coccineum]|uniref:Uncharacterized protein n=1 Tax=Tanacetum coccineum TaxID=301880 RepID=A0ABQ5BR98_9ASTR
MNTTQAQQNALDDALVAPADHLEFGKCNMRLKTDKYGYVKYYKKTVKNGQKRTRERMSDQEAKEIKAEAREIMPQPSTIKEREEMEGQDEKEKKDLEDEELKLRYLCLLLLSFDQGLIPTWNWMAAMVSRGLELLVSL